MRRRAGCGVTARSCRCSPPARPCSETAPTRLALSGVWSSGPMAWWSATGWTPGTGSRTLRSRRSDASFVRSSTGSQERESGSSEQEAGRTSTWTGPAYSSGACSATSARTWNRSPRRRAPTRSGRRPRPRARLADRAAYEVDDLLRGRAGREDLGHAELLQLGDVLGRDRAADRDHHVVGALLLQQVHHTRHE